MDIIAGQKFSEWTTVEEVRKDNRKQWLCRCSCGTQRIQRRDFLLSGRSCSCGCKAGQFSSESQSIYTINIGDRFGAWKVLSRERVHDGWQYLCLCDCGTKRLRRGHVLVKGETKSCGCKRGDNISESNRLYTLVPGTKYNKWTVLNKCKNGNNLWLCQCECGTRREIAAHKLIFVESGSCGCEQINNYRVKIGDVFGYWTVLEDVTQGSKLGRKFLCRCDCGTERIVYGSELIRGKSRSCGCYNRIRSSCNAGELSPHWRGGDTTYADDFADIRESIRDRDDHTCQICKLKESSLDRTLNTHHINYEKFDTDELNLIALCDSCHSATNFNREYWQATLEALQAKRFNLQTA